MMLSERPLLAALVYVLLSIACAAAPAPDKNGLFNCLKPIITVSDQANGAFRNWQGRHDARKPLAVAFPSSGTDVAKAVKCATAAGVPFVPRSGGHSYEAMSLINGGLIIDLTNMTTVAWISTTAARSSSSSSSNQQSQQQQKLQQKQQKQQQTTSTGVRTAASVSRLAGGSMAAGEGSHRITTAAAAAAAAAAVPLGGSKAGIVAVDPGTRLGVIYSWLLDQDLMFPGGTCPGVGLSGFLLGGGQGHSTRRLGMAADSIVGARVVTAAGEILEANSTHHSDLFWALRGGGANYAIVTQWRLQLYHQPPVVTVVLLDAVLSVPNLVWLMEAFMQWKPWELAGDFAGIDLRIEADTCGIKLVYWGSEAAAKQQLSATRVFADSPKAIGAKISYSQETFSDLIMGWTKASGQLPASAPWDRVLMKEFQTPAKLDPVQGYKSYRFSGGLDFAGAGFILKEPIPSGSGLAKQVAEVMVKHHVSMTKAGHLAVAYATVWGAQVSEPAIDFDGFGWRKRIINFQIGTPMRPGVAADYEYAKAVQQLLLPRTEGAMFYNYMSCLAGSDGYTNGDKWRAFFGSNAARLQAIKAKYDPTDVFAYGMKCKALD